MKETILLFNPPEKDTLLKIEMALFPLHIRLKRVARENYNQPLADCRAKRTPVPYSADSLRHN